MAPNVEQKSANTVRDPQLSPFHRKRCPYLPQMRSMTGFGRGNAEVAEMGLHIVVEINSVNRKTLDVQISAPREWSGYEASVNGWINGGFQRGRVNVQIKVSSQLGETNTLVLNTDAMAKSIEDLRAFAETNGLGFEPDSQFLLELARSLKDSEGLPDWKDLKAPLETAFQEALKDIDSMRLQEGAALATDLKERIAQLETLRQTISTSSQGNTDTYRKALIERLKELDLDLDINDERVLKEVAIFADRSDISEEITRLGCHFEQFLQFLDSEEATGRKMDFLCQEIHRELNTTGSKSNNIEITRAVIEGKNALERIREQVQNIE